MDRDGKIKKTLLIKTPENFVILSSDEFKKLAIPLNNIIKILLKLYDTIIDITPIIIFIFINQKY